MRQHRDHPYGTNHVNHERRIGYINIPKNASTSIKKVLRLDGYEGTLENFGYDMFAVIRNPYDRYLSGLQEFSRLNHCDAPKEVRVYDEHTEHQVSFLLPFMNQRIYLVKMENIHLLERFGVRNMPKLNVKDSKLSIDKEKVEQFYSQDVYLYELAE